MSTPSRLPQLELDCMKVLWKMPGATVAQVRASLSRPLAYTTVMTVLDRMSTKGMVARRKNGRAYVYSALLELDSARRQAVTHLLANLFENDREALLRYVAAGARPQAGEKARREKSARAGSRAVVPSSIDESLL